MEAKENSGRFTYADYATWDNEQRWELIDGTPYAMSPAPSVNHQRVLGVLFNKISSYLNGKECEVFLAPFDVRLDAEAEDNTVVQPDLIIICDPKKIENGKNCEGAPDMVVEILSPSTTRRDRIVKFNKYREAGVEEYWILDPEYRTLSVNLLKDGEYYSKAYGDTDQVPITILENCIIHLAEVFPSIETPSAAEPQPSPDVE